MGGDKSYVEAGLTGTMPAALPAPRPRSAKAEPASGVREVRVSWSPSEDAIIMNSVREFGHRWCQVAQRLPHRTDHAIRNRYRRLLSVAEELYGIQLEATIHDNGITTIHDNGRILAHRQGNELRGELVRSRNRKER